METLPYVDEHRRAVAASPEATWRALLRVLQGLGGSRALAALLGCDPDRASARFEGKPGDAVPGFRVVQAEPGALLALRGRHRFADYALTFFIEGGVLRAETHADFPGLAGRLYRAAVIGSGGHALVTRKLLKQVERVATA